MKSKFHWTTFVIIFALCACRLCVGEYASYLRSFDSSQYTHIESYFNFPLPLSHREALHPAATAAAFPASSALLCWRWMCGAHIHPTKNYQMTKRNENASNNRLMWHILQSLVLHHGLFWVCMCLWFDATRASRPDRWITVKAMTSFAIEYSFLSLDMIRPSIISCFNLGLFWTNTKMPI